MTAVDSVTTYNSNDSSTITTTTPTKSKTDHSAEINVPKTPTQEAIVRSNNDAKVHQQAQHTAVISLTVKNTNKILKEIGFRRARLRVSIAFLLVLYSIRFDVFKAHN